MSAFSEVKWFGFDRVDGTILFFNYVNSLCFPQAVVLDYGAGRGEYFQDDACEYRRNLRVLKGKVAKVIGADVDRAVFSNKAVDETCLIKPDGAVPLDDASQDIILADWVFEHIANPAAMAAEFKRLLKPGGWICARTPNKFGYVAMASRLIPEPLHDFVLEIVQPGRKKQDVFPTLYRMNTRKQLEETFSSEDFELLTFCCDATPSYAGNSRALFHVFRVIHALMPDPFKTIRLVFARSKRGVSAPSDVRAKTPACAETVAAENV